MPGLIAAVIAVKTKLGHKHSRTIIVAFVALPMYIQGHVIFLKNLSLPVGFYDLVSNSIEKKIDMRNLNKSLMLGT